MHSGTIIEVTHRLVGFIEPSGDLHMDEGRYANQEKLIDLVTWGIEELIQNSKYRNVYDDSESKIGNRAYQTLEDMLQMIQYATR